MDEIKEKVTVHKREKGKSPSVFLSFLGFSFHLLFLDFSAVR